MSEFEARFILIGIRDKRAVVWTGRAGDDYASENINDAIQDTMANIKRKAQMFNAANGPVRWTDIVELELTPIEPERAPPRIRLVI